MNEIKKIYDLDEAVRQNGDAMTRIRSSLMRRPRPADALRTSSQAAHTNPSADSEQQPECIRREGEQ
jgi:hypothetical protein